MKFKKVLSLFMSFVILLSMMSTLFIDASAQQVKMYSVIVNGITRSKTELKGPWAISNNSDSFAMHYRADSADATAAQITYCIEPGTTIDTNSTHSDSVSSSEYWNTYDNGNFNTTLTSDQVRVFVSRLIKYGFNGTINENWEGKNIADLTATQQRKVLKALATQVLIWEVIVGERDANFNHISPSSGASWSEVKSAYTVSTAASKTDSSITLRQEFNSFYNDLANSMKNFIKVPSFANGSTKEVKYLQKISGAYYYRMTLDDSNSVLSDFDVSYNDNNSTNYVHKIEKNGDNLDIYIKYGAPNDYKVNITFRRNEGGTTDITRPKLYIWGDTVVGNSGIQNIVGTDGTMEDKITANVSVQLKLGTIVVSKTSNDNKKDGFSFSVGNGVVDKITRTTNSNGIATFTGLPVGTYNVSEDLSNNVHYVVCSNQVINVTANKTTTAYFNNVNKKIRFKLRKLDAENGIAQGDGTLAEATYKLYRNNQEIATYVTNENGKFKYGCACDEISPNSFTGSPNSVGYTASYFATDANGNFYTYTLKEVSASEGYTINPETLTLSANGIVTVWSGEYNESTEILLNETPIKDMIRIYKHSDKDSTTNTPEGGAVFRIWLTSNGSFENSPSTERDMFTTYNSGNGYSKALPYGTYTVEQIEGKQGAFLAEPFQVKIDGTAESQKTYRNIDINNIPKSATIKVKKLDYETENAITRSSATFNLYDSNGNKLNENPLPTDNTGILMFPYSLDYGTYYIEEAQAPDGYMPYSGKIEVVIDDTTVKKVNDQYVVTVNVKNAPQKAHIQIYKTGNSFSSVNYNETTGMYTPVYDTTALKGAKFNIYAGEDIYRGDGTPVYSKNQKVATIVTDENGLAKTTYSLLLGEYYIQEAEAPAGYELSTKKYPIYLEHNVDLGKEYTADCITIPNFRHTTEITLKKELEVNDQFNIGNNDEYVSISFGLFAAKKIEAPDGTYIPADGLIETVKIDKNGNASFNNTGLPYGVYYVKELTTHSSYELNTAKYYFEISEKTFEDLSTEGPAVIKINDGDPIVNKIKYGAVSGIKVTESDEPLAGAYMGLFKGIATENTVFYEKDAIAKTYSDENGEFSFGDKIPYGEYTVYEITPPTIPGTEKSYSRIDEQWLGISFTINDENRNITESLLKFINKKPDNPVKIIINKTSENGRVEGFEFKVEKIATDGTITQMGSVVTDARGVAEVNGLDLNYTYRVTELENDKTVGFIIPDAQEQVADSALPFINDTFIMTFNFENKLKKGTIILNKTVEAGSLDGFEFYINGTTLTGESYAKTDYTNTDGKIVFENVPFGTYTISEELNDKSMEFIIPEPKTVKLSDSSVNATETVAFENVYPKGSMLITKSSPDDKKIEDIEFLVKGLNVDYEQAHKTDSNGKILINDLRVGLYEVSEIQRLNADGKNPYVELSSKTVIVSRDKQTDVETFVNRLKKGLVSIKKTSENNVVEGFTFNINGTTLSGETYDKNFVTNEDGYIYEIKGNSLIELNAGTYTVSEIATDKTVGYVIPEPVSFTIEDDGIILPIIKLHNKIARGKLKIIKTSDNDVVEGFSFNVKGKTLLGEDFESVVKTDVNGIATIEDIPLGTYTVTEIEDDASKGYVIEEPKEVVIETNGEEKEVTFNNVLKKGTINIIKTSEDNLVEGVAFNIKGKTIEDKEFEEVQYTDVNGKISIVVPAGEYVISEVENSTTEQYIIPDDQNVKIEHGDVKEITFHNVLKKGTLKIFKDSEDENIANISFKVEGLTLGGVEFSQTYKTNEKGIIEVVIPYGAYTITEEELDGYVENFPKEITIESELKEVDFYNSLKKGILKIKKTSTDGNVEGFSFKIEGTTDTGAKYSNILVTDEKGIITVKLPTGKYTVSEVENEKTKNYILPDPQNVLVFEDGVSVLKFKNIRKPEEVKESKPNPTKETSPQTGDIGYIDNNVSRYWLWLLVAGVSGILCIISVKKLKNDNE